MSSTAGSAQKNSRPEEAPAQTAGAPDGAKHPPLESCDCCGSAQENHGWACRCGNPPSKGAKALSAPGGETRASWLPAFQEGGSDMQGRPR